MAHPRHGVDRTGLDLGHQLVAALMARLVDDPAALEQLRELLAGATRGDTEVDRPAYTADSLAEAVGVTPKVVRNAIARGELAAVKRGGRWIVSADAVEAWARSGPTKRLSCSRVRTPDRAGPLATALGLADRDSRRRIAGP